jgi:hypothetical protein
MNGGAKSYFIVDSGAANVQIPEEMVEEMKRNGRIGDGDFLGQRRFILADGSGLQQRVFRIRTLQIGDRTMENVLAAVGAPRSRALLGQSFLRRLNWWKIDNVKNAWSSSSPDRSDGPRRRAATCHSPTRRRQAEGGTPTIFLKARLKAASDP